MTEDNFSESSSKIFQFNIARYSVITERKYCHGNEMNQNILAICCAM